MRLGHGVALCRRSGVSLQSSASLIVASLDLKVVRLLRDAIRAADAASGRAAPIAFIGPAPTFAARRLLLREILHPEPRFEPRPVIHPTPRFLPRPVIHLTPRFERASCAPFEPETPPRCGHGLPPPWKMPIWNVPVEPKVTIKRVVHLTDVHNKGSLIDLFI
jgi:hypothetical protein